MEEKQAKNTYTAARIQRKRYYGLRYTIPGSLANQRIPVKHDVCAGYSYSAVQNVAPTWAVTVAGCRFSFVRVPVSPLKLRIVTVISVVSPSCANLIIFRLFFFSWFWQVMIDPVVCEDGHSYERGALEAWLRNHDTSPMSNARLNSTMVVPNHALRNSIEAWRRMRGY